MLPGNEEMHAYIEDELARIDDHQTLLTIVTTILRHKRIPYTKFRTARLRHDSLQLRLFAENPHPFTT